MKIKGINPFERHVEKIVLGVFALFVLAVLLMQTGLLGGNRSVRVGASERPIDQALEGVKEMALQRQGRLQSDQVSPNIPASLPDPAQVFDSAFAASNNSVATLAALGQPSLRLGDSTGPGTGGIALPKGGDVRYAAIKVSKPSTPVAAVHEGTIDPVEVAQIGAPLASLLSASQPFDARVPSIEATFDGEALRKSIEAPEGDGVFPMPASFWQGKVELVDVEWFRQELGSDGQWGAESAIDLPPGRPAPRDLISKADFQPTDFRDLLERERTERLNIRRPTFYATVSGRPWVWPSQVKKEEMTQGAEDVTGLKRELGATRQELEEYRQRLDRLKNGPRKPGDKPGSPPAPPEEDRKGPGGGGGGGGGGGDRGPSADGRRNHSSPTEDEEPFEWPVFDKRWYAQAGGGTGGGDDRSDGPSPDNRRKERDAQAIKSLEEKIEKLVKREGELVAELEKKGVGVEAAAPPAFLDEPLASLSSAELKQITLWTHDLSAKPGKTYRYKARAKVSNPFYGQTDKLREDQQSLAADAVVVGDASDWSEPVTIDPNVVFFITSASEAGGPLAASARAGAEAYEFFYGYWRRTNISMVPGDALAGKIELPELVTFDLERTTAGQQSVFTVKNRPPVDRQRLISTGAFLLDTASIVSGAAGAAQAYLRHESGKIMVRRPASDGEESARRAHYLASANQGENAVLREPGTGALTPPTAPPPGGGPKGPTAPGQGPGKPPPSKPKQNPSGPPQLPGRERF